MKRKLITALATIAVLVLTIPTGVKAATVPAGNSSGHGSSGTSSTGDDESEEGGSGANMSGEYHGTQTTEEGTTSSSGEFEGSIEFPYPNYTTYYPKVTSLKSANALLADAGEAVYFLPTLADFPTDLRNVVADLTDGNGVKHRFAVVYAGYFDTDVLFQADTTNTDNPENSRVHTSKKVYSMDYNSRLCNYLGYDILLRDERYIIHNDTVNKVIDIDYNATRVNNSILDTQTMIMDLYKAVGVFEWDIEFAYGVDKDFDANTSPILQSIGVLTTDKNQGLDTKESYVWVAATRTNPDLYWARCERDLIFDGGAHLYNGDYWGNEVSVTGNFTRTYTPTLGEFCAMARAVMSLYGEPVLTEMEQKACIEAYGLYIPETGFSKDIYNSLVYLASKGIIDPSGKDFNATCTFEDIEEILLRIADEGARLTMKTPVWNVLSAQGFQQIDNCVVAAPGVSMTKMQSEDLPYYDFLVEVVPGVTTYTPNTLNTTSYGYSTYTSTGTTPRAIDPTSVGLLSSTSGISPTSNTNSPALSATGVTLGVVLDDNTVGFFDSDDIARNKGIVTYNGKQYYHLQLRMNQGFGGINTINTGSSVIAANTARYALVCRLDSAASSSSGSGLSGYHVTPSTEYAFAVTLPNCNGGVYNVSNTGVVTYSTFSDACYDSSFRDSTTTVFNTRGLTDYHASNTLISITVPMDGSLTNDMIVDHSSNAFREGWRALLSNPNTVINMGDNQTKAYASTTGSSVGNMWYLRIEFYCTDGGVNIQRDPAFQYLQSHCDVQRDGSRNIAFYRAESGSLLINISSLIVSGILANYTQIDENTYLLCVNPSSTTMSTNVTLHYKRGSGSNYLCIGNTLFPCRTMDNPAEVLFEMVDGELYVNYKAIIGWGSNVVLTPMSDTGTVYAYDTNWLATDLQSNVEGVVPVFITQDVREFAPLSTTTVSRIVVKCSYTDNVTNQIMSHTVDGLSLLSTYALAPYIMVAGPRDAVTGNTVDYLFTWHIRGLREDMKDVDDSAARAKFGELVGTAPLEYSSTYFLSCLSMSRQAHVNSWGSAHNSSSPTLRHTSQSQNCFTYAQRIVNTQSSGTLTIDFGWVYTPTYFSDVNAAMAYWDSMLTSPNFIHEYQELNLGLPIFAMGNHSQTDSVQIYGSANINRCMDITGTIQKAGVLPGYFCGTSSGLTELDSSGQLRLSSSTESQNADLTQYTVIPAPAGMFAAYGSGKTAKVTTLENTDQSVFWGTSRVSWSSDGAIKIGAYGELPLSSDVDLIQTFQSTMNKQVWVIDTDGMQVSATLARGDPKISVEFGTDIQKIDWNQFKLSRLVRSIDSWSTVLLIFVLNILPRVCVMLFFLLMLLSLATTSPKWRSFCNNYFDPYKALTLGHQNVNSVNLKQMFVISSIGIVAFSIMMDGAAISITLWLADWVVRLIG